MKVIPERRTAELEGDFVVFLIGMRMNKIWKFWKWFPAAQAMARMLTELEQKPELGLLHYRSYVALPGLFVLQYWRSFDQLHAYSINQDAVHLPAWRAFNKAIAGNADVGIWHETFLVKDGAHESVYNNMPVWGLAAAGQSVPAIGRRKSAKGRLKQTDGADQPVA
ncbi:MAG: DUF4188 domain-containing protein [Hyphomonadaceae bacterium]